MRRAEAIVIGGGQAGLAMSRCLADRGIDHAVLERGRVAERWRRQGWDSLRLLTPNWMSRLPGWSYRGTDPDGFMTGPEVVGYLEGYARHSSAPVETDAAVRSVRHDGTGYRVETSRGTWAAPVVVIATGHCGVPAVPEAARSLSGRIRQLTASGYRNPDVLPPGGVLVVGASASGVQIAEEIRLSGRRVILSAGRHLRLPRLYRGRDIMWWLDRTGILDERAAQVPDLERARDQPSLQLAGRPDRRTIDLAALGERGVRVVGRLDGLEGTAARFRNDLAATVAAAGRKLELLLARIDAHADVLGCGREASAPPAVAFDPHPPVLDLDREGVRTVIWATGFRRDYSWLQVPVLDPVGEIAHDGGITPSPGLYVLGLRFLRRRKSSFIDGVGADAEELAGDILGRLPGLARAA